MRSSCWPSRRASRVGQTSPLASQAGSASSVARGGSITWTQTCSRRHGQQRKMQFLNSAIAESVRSALHCLSRCAVHSHASQAALDCGPRGGEQRCQALLQSHSLDCRLPCAMHRGGVRAGAWPVSLALGALRASQCWGRFLPEGCTLVCRAGRCLCFVEPCLAARPRCTCSSMCACPACCGHH